MDCSPLGSLSTGFSRQEYWSGLPFTFPGDLLHAGIWTCVSYIPYIGRWILYHCTTWEPSFIVWSGLPNILPTLYNINKGLQGPPGLRCGSAGKGPTCNAGDLGSIPGLGRSPGEGKGYPLQYSGLENGWQRVGQDWATFTFTFFQGPLKNFLPGTSYSNRFIN